MVLFIYAVRSPGDADNAGRPNIAYSPRRTNQLSVGALGVTYSARIIESPDGAID